MSVQLRFMQLSEYLKANRISITAFAEMIGVARITIYSYLSKDSSKKKSPSADTLERIFDATKGQVRPDDFFPFCEPTTPKTGRNGGRASIRSSP